MDLVMEQEMPDAPMRGTGLPAKVSFASYVPNQ